MTPCNPALASPALPSVRPRARQVMRHGAVWAGLAREACGTLQIAWARWRGDDVLLVLGHRMRLVGRLQRAARVPRAAAAPEVDAWLTRTFRPLFGEITERCPASYPPYPVGD